MRRELGQRHLGVTCGLQALCKHIHRLCCQVQPDRRPAVVSIQAWPVLVGDIGLREGLVELVSIQLEVHQLAQISTPSC